METATITSSQAQLLEEQCIKRIELYNCLERLKSNPDFKKLFLEEYLEEEPVRLTHLLAETSFVMSEKRDIYITDIKEQLIGISRFFAYLRNIPTIAEQAKNTLNELHTAEIVN